MNKNSLIVLIFFISHGAIAKMQAQDTYQRFCRVCHSKGIAGAPVSGDREAWDKRIKRSGFKKLIKSVQNGKGAMPPGGMCGNCTEEDIEATIKYMRNYNEVKIKVREIF